MASAELIPQQHATRRETKQRANGSWQATWRRAAIAAIAVTLTFATYLPMARAARPATLPPPSAIFLLPSLPSPQPLGTPITWTAITMDSVPLVYRFSVATAHDGPYTIVRDFSARPRFVWAPLQEGRYFIRVTLQEGFSGATTVNKTVSYNLSSRVQGANAVVNHLANPLIALYSAPACATGQIMLAFRPLGTQDWTDTNSQPCQAGLSRNFLVAGMEAKTTYTMVHVIIGASTTVTSTPLLFTTGTPPPSVTFPSFYVPLPPVPASDTAENVVFHSLFNPTKGEANPIATDLQGHVIWYASSGGRPNAFVTRIQQVGGQLGSEIFTLAHDPTQSGTLNVLRALDLADTPLQETTIGAVNQQLIAQGKRRVYDFSHDALILPNGDLATIAHDQETITTTSIMGDMVIVLDPNLRVVWTWDSFDHLNPNRGPTLGDTCGDSYPKCPVPGGPTTIDWTHMNSISWSPLDQNLVFSLRSQDWVIKVNYNNGAGDGRILWRLGAQGDFRIVPLNPQDSYPWFSHQHDANYLTGTSLTLFDNGNTRCAVSVITCQSRGQTYILNEQTMVATQIVNAGMGGFSSALGTAQRLSNGNYNFTAGIEILPPPLHSQDIEVGPDGTQLYVIQPNTSEYRAWRLRGVYDSTNPSCPTC